MAKPTLALVPDDFTADATATPADKIKAHQAAGIREGRRRERQEQDAKAAQAKAEHAAHIAGLKSAQTDELERQAKLVGKGAHRDGVLQGVFLGLLIAVAISLVTWVIVREVFFGRVALGRVPQASVPAITDTYTDPAYERGAREPGTAEPR